MPVLFLLFQHSFSVVFVAQKDASQCCGGDTLAKVLLKCPLEITCECVSCEFFATEIRLQQQILVPWEVFLEIFDVRDQ